MIKKLPLIYPNELFYSFLSRAYMQSGIGSASEFNTFDILLIAFFEGISSSELCDGIRVSGNRTEVFDNKVKKLYEEGHNYTQISKILNVNHETIRKIILGIYNKEKAPIKVPKVLTSI